MFQKIVLLTIKFQNFCLFINFKHLFKDFNYIYPIVIIIVTIYYKYNVNALIMLTK